jgi:hypothetical protein
VGVPNGWLIFLAVALVLLALTAYAAPRVGREPAFQYATAAPW